MTETYAKKDKDILTVTKVVNETHITEENRVEIQTRMDRLELEKIEIQKKIDTEKNKITILDTKE